MKRKTCEKKDRLEITPFRKSVQNENILENKRGIIDTFLMIQFAIILFFPPDPSF